MIGRRQFLNAMGASLLSYSLPSIGAAPQTKPRLVWVVLRGAMDSLQAVVPIGDEHLMDLRRELVEPVLPDLLPLDSDFALHPAMGNLHSWYRQGQMAPVVAVATPYRERSHFSAQDVLESGRNPATHDSGWLGQAIELRTRKAVALAQNMPASMRSAVGATTWFPSRIPAADPDYYEQLLALYESSPMLSRQLEKALTAREKFDVMGSEKSRGRFEELAEAAGKMLADGDGPDAIMLEMGGWDTHNNQLSRGARLLTDLDNGLDRLRVHAGSRWSDTLVVIATEFGRTVAINGTRGTDHGTASAMFLAGGAMRGGRVLGDWPGLAAGSLYEGRDLMPTADVRAWVAAILAQHWQLTSAELRNLFPALGALPVVSLRSSLTGAA